MPPHPKSTHQLLSMVISRFFFPRHGSRENNHCFGGLLRVPERARKFVIITVRSGSDAASLSPCALQFAVSRVLWWSLASYLCTATAVVGWLSSGCVIWVGGRRVVSVGKGVSPPCLHYPPLCPPINTYSRAYKHRASRSSTESFSRTMKEHKCQEQKLHTTKVANRRDYMLKYGLCFN